MRALLDVLNKEKQPVVMAGDLNAVDTSAVIKALDEAFVRTCAKGCPYTIPVDSPSKTIDFIAFRPASRFRVIDHRVITEKYASDHLPVVSVIQLK
jgi:endonuclease/exonuclease/phosphatase family metal-dependent hydrolase